MRRSALALAVLLAVARGASSQAAPPSPNTQGTILVELFTSEGCSDCPLADTRLREINATHNTAGQLIVVLSEHVTYWDQLGWKDTFSDPVFTYRQNGYAARFHLDDVYTPQMVVNGERQFVGGNRQALIDALEKSGPPQHMNLHILSIEPQADALLVQFSAQNLPGTEPLDVMASVADDFDQTHVGGGENGGRTLTHAAVARSLERVAKIQGNTVQTVRIPLHAPLRQSAATPRHLVLFVQQRNFGRVLAADTRPLNPPTQH